MTNDQIRDLIALARSFDCRSLRIEGFEVNFWPKQAEVQEQDINALRDALQNPATEDEVKFWSAGGAGTVNSSGEPVVQPLLGEGDAD